jgi:hypothetical protein
MKNQYLGLDGKLILQEEIPFDYTTLVDRDVIYNAEEERLIYYKDLKGYRLMTNNPNTYLKDNGKCDWVKYGNGNKFVPLKN